MGDNQIQPINMGRNMGNGVGMPRGIHKLSARQVKAENKPSYYGDGAGLWLQVSKSGAKSWVFRYTRNGKTHDLGLGSYLNVPLATAREKAAEMRAALGRGVDPKAERDAVKAKARTFEECAAQVIAQKANELTNAKALAQWESTLRTYVYQAKLEDGRVFGDQVIGTLTKDDVASVLASIWTTKIETARRVRMRIEAVFSYAKVKDFFVGDNPATNELISGLLGKVAKKKNHHEAMDYRALPAFIHALRSQPGVAAGALEFTILTAARTGEVIGATWDEFDLEAGVWTIPAERMKAKVEHRLPLCKRAMDILIERNKATRRGEYVFPGWSGDGGLSNMAMLKLLKDLGYTDLTVHGFRSTFRDWAGETTAHPREVIEHALAHQLKDKAEAAYARGTLFEKRRLLMNDWCSHAESAAEPHS